MLLRWILNGWVVGFPFLCFLFVVWVWNLYVNIFWNKWWAEGNLFLMANTLYIWTQSLVCLPLMFEVPWILKYIKPVRTLSLASAVIYNILFLGSVADFFYTALAEKKEDLCKKWKQKQDARKALAAAQKKEGKVPKKKKTKAELKKDIMTAGGPSKWCADTDNMTAQPRFCAEVMRREIKKREEEASRKKAGGKGQYKDFKTQMMEMIKKAGGLRKYCKTLPNDAHDLHKRVCKNMNKLLSHCFKLRDKVDTGKMEETKKTKLCSEFIDHQRRR